MGRRERIKIKRKKPLIVICSEGGNNTSERIYFSNFKSRDVRIQFSRGNSTDPNGMFLDLKKYIINEDIMSEDECSIFLLLDTDLSLDRINKIKEIEKECKLNNVNIITSSPTFEIWYLMHYKSNGLKFNSSQEVKKEMLKFTNGLYSETMNIYPKIIDKMGMAVNLAKTIEQKSIKDREELYKVNPHTSVYKIIEKIDEYQKG